MFSENSFVSGQLFICNNLRNNLFVIIYVMVHAIIYRIGNIPQEPLPYRLTLQDGLNFRETLHFIRQVTRMES